MRSFTLNCINIRNRSKTTRINLKLVQITETFVFKLTTRQDNDPENLTNLETREKLIRHILPSLKPFY